MKIDKEKFQDAKEVAKQAVAHHCKTRWWVAMNHLRRAYGFTERGAQQ